MEKPMILGDTPANHELFTEDKQTFPRRRNPAGEGYNSELRIQNSELVPVCYLQEKTQRGYIHS